MPVAKVETALEEEVISFMMGACETMAAVVETVVGTSGPDFAEEEKTTIKRLQLLVKPVRSDATHDDLGIFALGCDGFFKLKRD